MATFKPVLIESLQLTGTVGANLAVAHAGVLPTAGARIMGITEEAGVSGSVVSVVTMGTTVGTSGGAILLGAKLEVTAAGKFVTQTTGEWVATARYAVSAADRDIEVFLKAG